MKQQIRERFTVILLIAVGFLLVQSCKKSSGDDANNNTSGYYLTANVNGQAWSANVNSTLNNSPAIAAVTGSGSSTVLLLLGLKAVNKDTTALVLIFPQNVALNKTLNFDPAQYLEGAYVAEITPGSGTYYGYNTTSATGGSGTITITLFDQSSKTIEGTFAGSFGSQQGRPAVKVTDGKFRCVYTTDITQLPKSNVKI
ncbi:MAG TPA: hypothetical protein VK645_15960 [Chitinophagaceae bacterium]|nr:hypothetical protein [Chitinophagaceae bacterium]